jgi:hypothetical protein
MTWDELRRRLHRDPAVEPGRGMTEADVLEAEAAIGRFPPDFRAYLLEFGSLTKEHRELYGLGPDVHPAMNVVTMSVLERKDAARVAERFGYLDELPGGEQ